MLQQIDPWSPFALRSGAVLRNRFVLAPMTTDASNRDGAVSPAELAYIRRRCAGQFGAAITSCAYVHSDGRSWQGIGAANEGHLPSLRLLAAAMRIGGGLALLQLYDGGRIAIPELVSPERIRAPSAVPSLRPNAVTPRELSGNEIGALLGCFRRAAEMGRDAGFDGIEIHGANHYLAHQFFSPRANRRMDSWGGSLTARMRFPLALAAAVRDAVGPDTTVGYRITPFESEPGGYPLDDAVQLAAALAAAGVDYVHISMDNFRKNLPQPEDRDWTKPRRAIETGNPIGAIAAAVDGQCAVIASGGIKTLADAREALELGADVVSVGRAALIDPDWINKLMDGNDSHLRTALPAEAAEIARTLTIPARMVSYILSRPGWIPRDDENA